MSVPQSTAEVDQAGNVVVFTWMVEGTDRISYTCSINDEEEFNCKHGLYCR